MSLKKSIINIGQLVVVIFILAEVAQATTLTVCPSGCDYTSIQTAVNAANYGDTINVAAGTYNENVKITKSLNLIGAGIGLTIVNAANSYDHVFEVTANNVNISRFTVRGATGSGAWGPPRGVFLNHSDFSKLENIESMNNNEGILLDTSSNNIITNNRVSSNNWDGIILLFNSNNNIVTDNLVSSNGNNGITVDSSSSNTVSNNTASSNVKGLFLWEASSNTFRSNTVSSNSFGIYLHNSSSNFINNNLFTNTNNSYFDDSIYSNTWNTAKQAGINIVGGSYLGGNFWGNPSGTGFSQTCTDADSDGICDSTYTLASGNIDNLPLSLNFSQNSIGYSVTITTSQQNTFIQSSIGNFGSIRVGQTKIINNSVILNNTGDADAAVDAKFISNIEGIYGLINGSNALNASNFAFGAPLSGSWVSLDNNGANVRVATVPFGTITTLDARLSVPPTQLPGDYSGTVILTFSNV